MIRQPDSAIGRRAISLFLRLLIMPTVILLSSCYPKYKTYTSLAGDYKVSAPFEWDVMTDAEGTVFTNTIFIGPYDPSFFLGAPSLSIRWHESNAVHKLPNGSIEVYYDIEEYVRQMMMSVYGDQAVMLLPGREAPISGFAQLQEIKVAGRTAKHFIVLSPAPVPSSYKLGVSVDNTTKERVVMRQHAYVLLPMENGFYVFVYPATKQGYKKYEKMFFNMVNSFVLLKEGPGGKPVAE